MPLLATLLSALLFASGDSPREEKQSVAKVALADLTGDPEKYAGRTVQVEGVVEETPKAKHGIATLWLEHADFAIVCEEKPDVVAGDRVKITATCELGGKPAKLTLHATVVEKIPEKIIAARLSTAELLKDPKKYDGKVIELEGALHDTPEVIEFMGEKRYSPRLCAGLQITCRGKPNDTKGDWVRITGTLTVEEGMFAPLTMDATLVERIPARSEEGSSEGSGRGMRPRFPRPVLPQRD
jgi:hypothetical protein